MSILLSGRIAAIKAQLVTLLSRVSANVALAATALSSTVWTGTKAGYLDITISSRASASALTTVDNEIAAIDTVVDAIKVLTDLNLDAKISEIDTTPPPGSDIFKAGTTTSGATPNMGGLTRVVDSRASSGYVTVLDITGSGVIEALFYRSIDNISSKNIGLRITVDGSVVYTDLAIIDNISDEDRTHSFIGGASTSGYSLGTFPYSTSFKVENFHQNVSQSVEHIFYKYYPT